MALKAEGLVDGGVHAEEAQGGASQLEPPHLALSSSHYLMRVFGTVVRPQPPAHAGKSVVDTETLWRGSAACR
jgi:hypothetical protein